MNLKYYVIIRYVKINAIKDYINENKFRVTDHAFEEMKVEGFVLKDVADGIISGKIIEDYPNAYPLPACLINGKTKKGRPVHVCVSSPPLVKIITVYEPSPEKWEDDFKKRSGA